MSITRELGMGIEQRVQFLTTLNPQPPSGALTFEGESDLLAFEGETEILTFEN